MLEDLKVFVKDSQNKAFEAIEKMHNMYRGGYICMVLARHADGMYSFCTSII